jgi:biopolymer transport protein TolQ
VAHRRKSSARTGLLSRWFDHPSMLCYFANWISKITAAVHVKTTILATALLLQQSLLRSLVAQTGWVARIDLLVLLGFSVVSWAVILEKLRQFRGIDRELTHFLKLFRSSDSLPRPEALEAVAGRCPFTAVYRVGYERWGARSRGNPHPIVPTVAQAVAVEMQAAAAEQMRRLERWMPFLATTASVSPFIGLFGTVWGVMDAFSRLGEAGAASLRATAPGIAEALVTTAAGLFAAIPAVIAYNHFLHRIRDYGTRLDHFTAEVLARMEAG